MLVHRVGGIRRSWLYGATFACMVLSIPIISVLFVAIQPSGEVWSHLLETSLLKYIVTTLILSGGVGISTLIIGTSTAWLITMFRFPGKNCLNFLLLLPFAMPSYVIAYAYTDLLEYAGPVQTILRELGG